MEASFLVGNVDAHATTLNRAIAAGKRIGLVSAPWLQITDGQLQVGANSGIFGAGVFYSEANTVASSLGDFGNAATVKTIVWQLDSQLYAQPSLQIIDGALEIGADDFRVVLGWIFYPGGGLTLTTEMLVAAPVASDSRIIASARSRGLFQSLQNAIGSSAEASISYNDMWTTIASTTSTTRTWRYELEVECDRDPVSCIRIDVGLSSQAFLRSYVKRPGENIVSVVDGSLNGSLAAGTWKIPLLRHRITAWERFTLAFDVILQAGASAQLGSIRATNEMVTSPAKA
jgi:hypothetical protein